MLKTPKEAVLSINRVNISGNLTRDPQLRSSASGTSILTFSVAVNDRRKGADGEWEDVPNYVDCVAMGGRADWLARTISKGSKVALEGKLRYSSWEKDGQRRSKLEVMVEAIEVMERQKPTPPDTDGVYDEDCPF